jgi:hypothetical protein
MNIRSIMKMKKSDLVIAFLIIAVVLGGVLAGLASCQNAPADSLPLPPKLPYASITGEGVENYRFSLIWKMVDGILSPSAVYDPEEAAAAIYEAYNTWELFKKKIDARPHAVPADPDAPLDLAVWTTDAIGGGYVLNNNGTKKIVVNRCWPQSLIGTTLTRADWIAARAEREKEFKQAVKDIEAMMASIEKSPLYEFEVNNEPLLVKLHDSMAEVIAFPADVETFACEDRDRWAKSDLDDSGGQIKYKLDTVRTGPLFEYFFGYVPLDTDYISPKGQLSFPE